MNCSECEGFFAARLEDLLDDSVKPTQEAHLATCSACQTAMEETRRLIDRLNDDARLAAAPLITTAVMDRIVLQQALQLRRYRIVRHIMRTSVAAALLIGVCMALWHFVGGPFGGRAQADDLSAALQQVKKAETATWTQSYYCRYLSADGKRSKWLRVKDNNERLSHKTRGLYRCETLNEDGQANFVSIEDASNKARLELNSGTKTATLRYLVEPSYSPRGPFALFTGLMERQDLQALGKMEVGGREATGFRYAFFAESANQNWSYDFWIDAKSKHLLVGRVPGGDILALADIVPDKLHTIGMESIDVDGKKFTVSRLLGLGNNGYAIQDVVLGAKLDDALFSLTPPNGYVLKTEHLPEVNEKDVIEFLRIVAEYFHNTFPDRMPHFNHGPEYDRFETIEQDVLAKRGATRADINMVEAMHKWWRTGVPGPGPMHVFLLRNVVEGTWKYLGKGVKLGDKSQVVCWYRLKNSKTYHVVCGDLSVKDVRPEELPLPVKP